MEDSIVSRIESFFATHQKSGEFVRLPREAPYQLIGAATSPAMFVYTTKQAMLSEKVLTGLPPKVSVIERYGLPATEDLAWIERLIGDALFGFVGDLDPVDLLIFAWVKSQLPNTSIRFLGLGDRILSQLGPAEKRDVAISLSPTEIAAIPLLDEVLPEWDELIGRESHALIVGGSKIELEGVIHGNDWKPNQFLEVLIGGKASDKS